MNYYVALSYTHLNNQLSFRKLTVVRQIWCTEDMLVLLDLKDTPDGPTFQLPNNATINAKKTGSIPLSGSLSTHAKKAQVFDVLHI